MRRLPEVGSVVAKVLREGAAEGRYDLGSWVVMPNHVHVLLTPRDSLRRQIAWIKGRTAFEANRVMKRSGSFWAKDYFDRWIRTRNEWEKVIQHVERNPVKAGLCTGRLGMVECPPETRLKSRVRAKSNCPAISWTLH